MLTQTLKTLKDNKLFLNLKDSDLPFDLISENIVYKNKGSIIYSEGDPAESIYLILAGNVKIIKDKILGVAKQESRTLNDFFGEEDYLEGMPRTSTAIAFDDCQLVRLNTLLLEQLIIHNRILEHNLKRIPIAAENIVHDSQSSTEEEKINIDTNENQLQDLSEEENYKTQNIPEDFENVPEKEFEISDLVDDDFPDPGFKLPDEFTNVLPLDDNILKEEENVKLPVQDEASELENNNDEETKSIQDESLLIDDTQPEIIPAEIDGTNTAENKTEEKDYLEKVITLLPQLYASKSTDALMCHLNDIAPKIFNASKLVLLFHNKEGNSFYTEDKKNEPLKMKSGLGRLWAALLKKENINIKNPTDDPSFVSELGNYLGFEIENLICDPLLNNNEVSIGMLLIANSSNGNFSKEDENIVSLLAKHIAISYENINSVEKILDDEKSQSLVKMSNFLLQDVKKPILVSKRYVEHLKNKKPSADILQVLDLLTDQLNHVHDIIQSTSSYSEGKTILQAANTKLNAVLNEILGRLESNARIRNCEIVKQLDPNDSTLKIDKKEFYHCCMHIIRNACDAMPDGGKIFVSTRTEGNVVKISFKDNGSGIPENIIGKIFDAFVTYGKTEGSGLGLSVTRKIISDHGGKISVESKPGEGAEFTITLPAVF